MIIPIRCFSCGRSIGHLWERYVNLLNQGKTSKEALDELELERMCCRQIFLGNLQQIETIAKLKRI